MKLSTQVLLGLTMLFAGCNSSDNETVLFIETQPSFYALRHGSWVENNWIRKKENLLAIHETFKRFGYDNLITDNILNQNPLIIQDIYINRTGRNLLDSLEFTFSKPDIDVKYYKEFWNRRRAEGNAEVVYQIIQDINSAIKAKTNIAKNVISAKPDLVNDTLLSLLQIEYSSDTLTKALAEHEFEELRRLGFHQSAYTLLYESYRYQDIELDRDNLLKTLQPSKSFTRPWFEDNTP